MASRQIDYAERIRTWFDVFDITQQQLAVEAGEEPATVSRNIAECDPYKMFQYGRLFEKVVVKRGRIP